MVQVPTEHPRLCPEIGGLVLERHEVTPKLHSAFFDEVDCVFSFLLVKIEKAFDERFLEGNQMLYVIKNIFITREEFVIEGYNQREIT